MLNTIQIDSPPFAVTMPPKAMVVDHQVRMESRPVSRFRGRRVHFIGIGGCGMAGLARMLLDDGALVTGTDSKASQLTEYLADRGAKVAYQQDGSLLSPDVDLVIRTAAIPDSNPEFMYAHRLGLKHIKYAQLLGQVMAERFGIAISGTHGKTTTTSMAAFALKECGKDPSFVIGGTVPQLGGSSHSGSGEAFVVEACEFDRSFHNLSPRVAVITNIEADHLDCYTNGLEEIIESFRAFALRVPPTGRIIANAQDANVRKAVANLPTPVEYFAVLDIASAEIPTPTPDWICVPAGIRNGCWAGTVYYHGQAVAHMEMSVPGKHNLYNAVSAIAACATLGVHPADAARAIDRFGGADRRMTKLGTYNGATVVDDYGHHPTEIRTTLRALREKYTPERLICVFQPHQHSRTRHLLDDFATAFVDSSLTLLPDIYSARDSEEDKASVSTMDLVQRIRANGQNAQHLSKLSDIVAHLKENARPGDLIVTMGAGNICDVGHELVAMGGGLKPALQSQTRPII
jgi:UDP-N-acetylmuramate--alanine ligase